MSLKYRNYMEDCVEQTLKTVAGDLDVCKCESCLMDISAIALNSLKPKYVVTKKDLIYEKLGLLHLQTEVDVIAALTNAAAIVKNNPRH